MPPAGAARPVRVRTRRLRWIPLVWGALGAVLLLLEMPVWYALGWAAALALGWGVRLEAPERAAVWLGRLWFVAAPPAAYSLVEYLNGNNGWTDMSFVQGALNLCVYSGVAVLLRLLWGRTVAAARGALIFGWALGMINHYVVSFRGRTIFPADLLTLQTAANVAGGYDYTPDAEQVEATVVFLVLFALMGLCPRKRGRHKLPIPVGAAGWAALGLLVYGFYMTDFLSWMGISPSMWTTTGNGLALNFSVCLRYSAGEEPEGYSQERLEELTAEEGEAPLISVGGAADGTQPVNIIVVMNESFSDLWEVADLETNQDCLPFWRSLTENTIRGTAYSSVFGGTTANSEYEFLTGNTTAFLPTGAVGYQLYISDNEPSLVGQLSALGYSTLAMHPYYSSGWNRVAVYEDFGFETVLFNRDFTGVEYIRGYISDRTNYENLIARFEDKEEGAPFFLFNVTMQNHSGYTVPWTNLERTVWLTGEREGKYPTVDQYLSLIYQSDQALEYLVDYFAQVEEPTLLLVFGDHQPQVASAFYTDVMGGPLSALDCGTAQTKYAVPFLIWANYDIPEAQGVELSLNYLSTLLMQTANLPLTGYQQTLSRYYQVLPVVNTMGYRDGMGTWSDREEDLTPAAQAALADYRILCYANVFDKAARPEDFFFLAAGA